MARPRVFVSSTFYDLKHLRATLDRFIAALGFEAILFENGDIPYAEGKPLDQSCYSEVKNADIFVLIIGGRYGSRVSPPKGNEALPEEVISITREEFRRASARGIPVYVLVENAVHAELDTFRRNRGNADVKYAHVDSVYVFEFLEEILGQAKPVYAFSRPQDVEEWLRAQWAGRFRDLIQASVEQRVVEDVAVQIGALRETTETLKTYLEHVVRKISRQTGDLLVKEQSGKLEKSLAALRNPLVRHCSLIGNIDAEQIVELIRNAKTFKDAMENIAARHENPDRILRLRAKPFPFQDANKVRELLELPPFIDAPPSASGAVTSEDSSPSTESEIAVVPKVVEQPVPRAAKLK